MLITDIPDAHNLTRADYDQLTCCGQQAIVAHATESLPVPGAVCGTCMCAVTSPPGYGPATVGHCARHAAA